MKIVPLRTFCPSFAWRALPPKRMLSFHTSTLRLQLLITFAAPGKGEAEVGARIAVDLLPHFNPPSSLVHTICSAWKKRSRSGGDDCGCGCYWGICSAEGE